MQSCCRGLNLLARNDVATQPAFMLRLSSAIFSRRALRRLLVLVLPALLLFPSVMPGEPDASLSRALDSVEERIRLVEFDNGLRLILIRNDFAPVVACHMKFRAGSADESDRTSGIAHMLEHMLFKGTPRVGTRDWQKEEKYLRVLVSWMDKLDRWRRIEEEARAAGDDERVAEAQQNIRTWRVRLDRLNAMARQFVLTDQDSMLYSSNGARGYNAYTTADLTNYQVQLPVNRIEVWARLESDRMQNSVLRDFYTERYVVAEERRMRVENDARRALLEKFLIEAYGEHPYGRPVIGPMQSIQYLNYNMAMDFYHTYYAPNNAVIALAGDIDFDETEAMVRRYFAGMEPRRIHRQRNIAEPVGRRLDVSLEQRGSPIFFMAWFKPVMPDPRDLYLEILGEILAGGQHGRLYRRLVQDEGIAANVNIYSAFPGQRFTNMFIIQVEPSPDGTYEQIQASLLDEIAKVRTDGVTEAELERVRTTMRTDFIYRLRSNDYLADTLSYFDALTGDYRILFEFNRKLDTVTTQDIEQAAAEFLVENRTMTARLLPTASTENQP
ncbi:MAG: insulinase family protein [Leptospiraceae bacterium]|nr:insulinase family protein [Leptospiraceae bacterium]